MRRTGGVLENVVSSVNGKIDKFTKHNQGLTNMVQYYRKKPYIFGME
jgi:hypothetical protein